MAGPTLTPNMDGNPWVEVFPESVPAGTATLRMYRYSENRTWLVRGGVDVAPGVAMQDFEVPFRTPATYRAECFNSAGTSLGFTESSTIELDIEGTWVHQPLQPLLATRVNLRLDSNSGLIREVPGESAYPEGAVVGRWIGARRRGLRGVNIALRTTTLEAANTLQAMVGAYDETEQLGVLCLRTSSAIRWPRTFFFAVPELVEQAITVHVSGERIHFDAVADEVEPPFPGLVMPLLTYDDLDAYYGTYSAQDAAYATYTDRDRDYSLAGFASQ